MVSSLCIVVSGNFIVVIIYIYWCKIIIVICQDLCVGIYIVFVSVYINVVISGSGIVELMGLQISFVRWIVEQIIIKVVQFFCCNDIWFYNCSCLVVQFVIWFRDQCYCEVVYILKIRFVWFWVVVYCVY